MPSLPKAGRGAKVGCIDIRVLTGGTWDAPPMLLITVERAETMGYLINCGEGVQRFCVEHKMRLVGKLQRVLLTRLCWDTCGGIPGMLLSMNEGGNSGTVRLHGPARLPQLVSSFRGFVIRHALPQEISETPDDWPDAKPHEFTESGIVATPVLVDLLAHLRPAKTPPPPPLPTQQQQQQSAVPEPMEADEAGDGADTVANGDDGGTADDGPETAEPLAKRPRLASDTVMRAPHRLSAAEAAAARAHGSTPEEAAAVAAAVAADAAADGVELGGNLDLSSLPAGMLGDGNGGLFDGMGGAGPASDAKSMPTVCWLLEMPPVPPKFDAQAAERLGIPPGEMRSQLCAGQTVTLPSVDGAPPVSVQPSEVLIGGSPGELVLIVDLPSEKHVPLLAAHPALAPYAEAGAEKPTNGDDGAAPPAADAAAASASQRSIDVIVHLSPASVCAAPEYVAWCSSHMAAGATHLFTQFTPQEQRFAFIASARMQLKLHGVRPPSASPCPLPLPALLLRPVLCPNGPRKKPSGRRQARIDEAFHIIRRVATERW